MTYQRRPSVLFSLGFDRFSSFLSSPRSRFLFRSSLFFTCSSSSHAKYESSRANTVNYSKINTSLSSIFSLIRRTATSFFFFEIFSAEGILPLAHDSNMGNKGSSTSTKFRKKLTEANITELSSVSGFTPEQVREWHTGFLVSRGTPL